MRNAISRLAYRIERQMDEAAERKGKQSWHAASAGELLMSVTGHLHQLRNALADRAARPQSRKDEARFRAAIVHEATDAAAYLMMIADNAEIWRKL